MYSGIKQRQALAKSNFKLKLAIAFGVIALVCAVGAFVSLCSGHAVRFGPAAVVPAYPVTQESPLSAPLHRLNARGDCNESSIVTEQATVDGVSVQASGHTLDGNQARATGALAQDNSTEIPVGVSVPVSTQTALKTLYTIRTTEQEPTTTQTTTMTTVVTIPYDAPDMCSEVESTLTVTVTVEPAPPAYGSLGDATVTASPSTHTYVQTDVSYTSGLPDATVSGNPSTVTNVQTDTAFTSGLPDATVSGDPSTVTDIIITTALTPQKTPTVTVTITDLWGPWTSESMVTVTSIHTFLSTIRTTVQPTVTVPGTADSTVLGGGRTASTTPTTYTEYVTVTGGEPFTSTTTVGLPQPYGDPYETYGTGLPANATNSPIYVPPVVSGAGMGCKLVAVHGLTTAVAVMAIVGLVL